jgi:hypothetical protein
MDYINQKICHLAESLLIKGEFLSWQLFSLPPLSISDIEIAPTCNKRSDRLVVEKIIATGIVGSILATNATETATTYSVEVLAVLSSVSSWEENERIIVASDSSDSYEHSITFTIRHNPDESFTLLGVMF